MTCHTGQATLSFEILETTPEVDTLFSKQSRKQLNVLRFAGYQIPLILAERLGNGAFRTKADLLLCLSKIGRLSLMHAEEFRAQSFDLGLLTSLFQKIVHRYDDKGDEQRST